LQRPVQWPRVLRTRGERHERVRAVVDGVRAVERLGTQLDLEARVRTRTNPRPAVWKPDRSGFHGRKRRHRAGRARMGCGGGRWRALRRILPTTGNERGEDGKRADTAHPREIQADLPADLLFPDFFSVRSLFALRRSESTFLILKSSSGNSNGLSID